VHSLCPGDRWRSFKPDHENSIHRMTKASGKPSRLPASAVSTTIHGAVS
jgi:hypothetical protein